MKKLLLIISVLFILTIFTFASTVTMVTNGQTNIEQWTHSVQQKFEKENPNIKLKIIRIVGLNVDYATKLALMLKTSSKIDIVFMDSFLVSDFNASNLLAQIPFNHFKEFNKFYKSSQTMAKINGKYYGIPFQTGSRALMYNKSIFKKAGIALPWHPKNWAQLIATIKKIKKNVPGVMPFYATSVANSEATSMQNFEMLLYGTNNRLMKNGKWVTTSQGFYNSLKFIQQVFAKHYGPRPGIIVNPNSALLATTELAPKGKAAIILSGTWNLVTWANKFPYAAKNYVPTPMPTEYGQGVGHISLSGGWVFAINKKSRQKKLAEKVIQFYTNKTNLLAASKLTGGLAVRPDVTMSPNYPKVLKVPTTYLKFTEFRPLNVYYSQVSKQISNVVEMVALGRISPKHAMENYARAVIQIVGKKNTISFKYNTHNKI